MEKHKITKSDKQNFASLNNGHELRNAGFTALLGSFLVALQSNDNKV